MRPAQFFAGFAGIAQQGLQGRLNRRVLLEFGIFALVALILGVATLLIAHDEGGQPHQGKCNPVGEISRVGPPSTSELP